MIDLGYIRINVPYVGKFYISYIGKVYLKQPHPTATQAKEYAEKVNQRYESLRKCLIESS
jgi:hypothetical protein